MQTEDMREVGDFAEPPTKVPYQRAGQWSGQWLSVDKPHLLCGRYGIGFRGGLETHRVALASTAAPMAAVWA